jgi:HAD superfamily hydrolase (TIGR01484 family)
MKPLACWEQASRARIEGLLFDLDDTLLTHGVLERDAYQALWDLHDASIPLVVVTGRPSAWGELLVRQWPIRGAVTENGAVFVVRDGRSVRATQRGSAEETTARRERLRELTEHVRQSLPHVRLADDGAGRRGDVAWDIGESHVLAEADIQALSAIVAERGARVTRSSVHLHGSFEADDKATGALRFLHAELGVDPGRAVGRWAFAGDSGNDAACFAAFCNSIGVANVREHLRFLRVPPRFVTVASRGKGFAELGRALLDARVPG